MNKIQYRIASETDIPGLITLYNSQYARKANHAYFNWQYFNSVFPTVLSCAFHNDVVVGMFGLQKKSTNNGLKIGQAIDMLIDPDYRGKGIFKEMGNRAHNYFNDLDLLCVLPNFNGKNAIENKMQWNTLGRIDCFQLSKQPTIPEGCTNDFIDSFADSIKYKFTYNEKIIDWRFTNNPFHQYSRIEINDHTYSFVKFFKNEIDKKIYGDIVYFHFDNIQSLFDLLIQSVKYLKSGNANVINMWYSVILEDILKNMGFERIIQERYFCLKVLKNPDSNFESLNNWHLMMADSEML